MAVNEVTINEDICKGCALCTVACPKEVLELDRQKLNAKGYNPAKAVKPDNCVACAMCAVMCPDSAITVMKG